MIFFLACMIGLFSSSAGDIHETVNDPQEIHFFTPDNIKIIGDLYVTDKEAPILLLFHQGGSNARAEYRSIIPRLLQMSVNILAIDQRVGGQYYGEFNRTLAGIRDHIYGDGYGYCDAYNNLESALDYVIGQGFVGKKILWGSSYSASLAIILASKRSEDVDGVLSFSPASSPAMKGCIPTEYLEGLGVPLLLLRPPNEMESDNVVAQFELAKTSGHQVYAPEYGIHGSSMLVEDRVGHDIEPTWKVVTSFIENIRK